jgi:hypothetical protein
LFSLKISSGGFLLFCPLFFIATLGVNYNQHTSPMQNKHFKYVNTGYLANYLSEKMTTYIAFIPFLKEVKRLNKKVLLTVLMFAAIIAMVSIAPASTKNFNYPEGQNITYISGGEGIIAPPAGYFGMATSMRLKAHDVEIGTHGSGDNLEIDLLFPLPTGPIYLPIAYFTTNPNTDVLVWLKSVLNGFPCASLPNNMRYVSDDVLIVERHGNSITVELTAPQTILMMTSTGAVPVVVPAFTMELNKVGGSVHNEEIIELTGYPGASGYTGYIEEMGFNAKGAFTSQAWSYANHAMTDCFIIMHGKTIYVPP